MGEEGVVACGGFGADLGKLRSCAKGIEQGIVRKVRCWAVAAARSPAQCFDCVFILATVRKIHRLEIGRLGISVRFDKVHSPPTYIRCEPMVQAGSNVLQNTTLLCTAGELYRLIAVTSSQRDENLDIAGPIGPRFKPKIFGGLFQLSQKERWESARPIVEIPR